MYHRFKVAKYLDIRDVLNCQCEICCSKNQLSRKLLKPNPLRAHVGDILPSDTWLSGSYKEFKCKIKKHKGPSINYIRI